MISDKQFSFKSSKQFFFQRKNIELVSYSWVSSSAGIIPITESSARRIIMYKRGGGFFLPPPPLITTYSDVKFGIGLEKVMISVSSWV